MLRSLHHPVKLRVVCVEGTANLVSEDFQCFFHFGLSFSAIGRCSCKKEGQVLLRYFALQK